ncbi:MAG: peptidyl-prolyl cis-trans isomerase [Thermodesulfobacteriota bacterium]
MLFLVLVGLAACSGKGPAEAPELARVDDKPITLQDFLSRAAFMGLGNDPAILTPELRKAVLQDLVRREMVLAEGTRRGIELSPQDLARQEQAVRRGLSDDDFKKTLAGHGISYDQWRREMGREALSEKILSMMVLPKVRISPEEVQKYYQEHLNEYRRPEQILAQHALLPNRKLAQQLVDRVVAGQDLGQAAAELGAPLGEGDRPAWLSRGHMPPALENKVFALKPGQLAGPLPSPYGFHVVRVMGKRPATVLTLEQATSRIRRDLAVQRKEALAAAWLEEMLSKASVWYHTQFIDTGRLEQAGSN